MYAIEKNIPLPHKPCRMGRPSKYPFSIMNVSESFVVPADSVAAIIPPGSHAPRVAASAYEHGRRYGKKFTYRKDDTGNVRVWRIA